MNSVIELHDSEVVAIAHEGENVIIRFASVYIHKSDGRPGLDHGTVWAQPANLLIGGGSIEGRYPDFPCRISDGILECAGAVSDNILPLPFECQGNIKLELIFTTDAVVRIVGDNAVLNLHGQAEYVEDFR